MLWLLWWDVLIQDTPTEAETEDDIIDQNLDTDDLAGENSDTDEGVNNTTVDGYVDEPGE